ncbi:hypothetical protein GF382_01620 [Candidatus Falkowbacteria bacterium]|nr:hypothetical protein [Candidatus Falkowbacteria bacterium]
MADKGKTSEQGRSAVLLLVDGWGVSSDKQSDPLSKAHTPFIDSLVAKYPVALLKLPERKLSRQYQEIGSKMADILEAEGMNQLKIAEPDKYTYLALSFNENNEKIRKGEERLMIGTTDEDISRKPALSSLKAADAAIKALKEDKYALIAVSLANLDLAACTKDGETIIRAMTAVDKCIKKIAKTVLDKDSILFISACRSGAEKPLSNVVPLVMVSHNWEGRSINAGEIPGSDLSLMRPSAELKDIAPTLLASIGVDHKLSGKKLIHI